MRSLNWWSRSSSSSSPSPVVSCSATGMNPISWSVCVLFLLVERVWTWLSSPIRLQPAGLKLDVASNALLYLWYCFRALDALFNFLLVWYYCTLTIRESILITNGSRCVTASPVWSLAAVSHLWRIPVSESWEVDAVFTRVPSGSKAGGFTTTMCPPSCLASCSPGQFTSFSSESVKLWKGWPWICLVPTGLKAFSIKCSGTSLYPTVSTKVRSLLLRNLFGPGWLNDCLAVYSQVYRC